MSVIRISLVQFQGAGEIIDADSKNPECAGAHAQPIPNPSFKNRVAKLSSV